jgi:hypothetical protein
MGSTSTGRVSVQFRVLGENELRRESMRFNDLWDRSRVALPTTRAEHVLKWRQAYCDSGELLTVFVEQESVLVAALVIVRDRLGPISIGKLPTNSWQPSGELLLDESQDHEQSIDALIAGLQSLRLTCFDFGIMLPGTRRWRLFLEGLKRADVAHAVAPRFDVALVDAAASWQDQAKAWSANHRRRVKRNEKLLQSSELSVDLHSLEPRLQNATMLDILWRLEAKSWKGARGDSVEQRPALVEFYRQQAQLLSEAHRENISARIAILRHNAKPIAAIYSWLSCDVCHLWKTGYDPDFAQISPGSLLLQEVIRAGVETGECRLFNLMGEMSAAHASWATRTFEVGRLLFQGNSGVGRAAISAYRAIRRLRGREEWRATSISEPWPLELSVNAPVESAACR